MEIQLLYDCIHENTKNHRWNKLFKILNLRLSYYTYMFPLVSSKKRLKIRKWYSEVVNLRSPENTMAKRIERKWQTMIYKILHRKLKIEQHEPQQHEPQQHEPHWNPWCEPRCSGMLNNSFSICYKSSRSMETHLT